jgi:hypothetical protein
VGTLNSQKKSPRNSAKSRQDTSGTPEAAQKPFEDFDEEERYMDRSGDHVARVRAAKEAA